MVAVFRIGRGRADLGHGLGHAHRLVHVVDVVVLEDGLAVAVQRLEDNDVGVLEAGAVELEGHGLEAVRLLGGELYLFLHRVPADRHRSGRCLVHHDALDDIAITGHESCVEHLVLDANGGVGRNLVVAVGRIGRDGADLGVGLHLHSLPLVVDVRVRRHLDALMLKALEGDDLLARERGCVEGELHLHVPEGRYGGKLLLGRDLGAVHDERLSRRLVHEGSLDRVGPARHEVGVCHLVDDGDGAPGRKRMVSVGRICRLGGELRDGLVVHGAQVDVEAGGRGVAAHVEGVLPKGVALVRLAAELLDAVLAEGKGAQLVVGLRHGSVLALAEPDARVFHHIRSVDIVLFEQLVVRVHRILTASPFGGGVQHTVAVGHSHMRLSRGHVGDEEGNVRELATEDRALLLQVGIMAHDLIAPEQGFALAVARDGLAVLAHLEGAGSSVGEQVAVVGRRLGDGVGSVRQRVGCGLCRVGSLLGVPGRLDHGHDGALGPVGVLHHDAVLGCVHDRELDALKGAAEIPLRIESGVVGSS